MDLLEKLRKSLQESTGRRRKKEEKEIKVRVVKTKGGAKAVGEIEKEG